MTGLGVQMTVPFGELIDDRLRDLPTISWPGHSDAPRVVSMSVEEAVDLIRNLASQHSRIDHFVEPIQGTQRVQENARGTDGRARIIESRRPGEPNDRRGCVSRSAATFQTRGFGSPLRRAAPKRIGGAHTLCAKMPGYHQVITPQSARGWA